MENIPDESKCIIKTKDGPICGVIEKSDKAIHYYKFRRIPYAKPPIGILRFRPPCPIQSWTDILDCTQPAPCFTQKEKDSNLLEIIGTEDNLYIDISTPEIKPTKPLPVMFWIGCMSFIYNIDCIYDPSLINDQEVVFVKCGYRLGPFGFLSINDFTAPGNCGLKDLVMALKWVQLNIASFGGDPNNVTIFGNGTGGVIVHMMTLSPLASGLFHKAIIQSASALNNWSLDKNPSQNAIDLAKELDITKTNKLEVVEELRKIPAADIMKAFIKLTKQLTLCRDIIDSIFKPCIEIEFEGEQAFLPKNPLSILKSGNFNKVPMIIGCNNIEAAVLQSIKENFYEDYQKYNEDVCLLVPKVLNVEPKLSRMIGRQMLNFYLDGDEHLREDTRTQYLQLISDYYFLYYVHKTVRLHNQIAPGYQIYYYILNCTGEWTVPKELNFFKSGHEADAPFLFELKLSNLNSVSCKGSRDSKKTRSRVVKMWTNFAKFGNPTPDDDDPLLQITWDPVEHKDKLNYLNIGTELTKGRNPFQERMNFWDDLHKEHTLLRTLVYFNEVGIAW